MIPLDKWYVYYTMPKTEKRINEFLEFSGYNVYLPLKEEIRIWSDRRKKLILPMFPNYIFVKTIRKDIYNILKCRGVVRYLSYNSNPVALKEDEVDRIRRIEDKGTDVEVMPSLVKGEVVRIAEGPFTGFKGVVNSKNSKNRFSINLQHLHCSISVNIDGFRLEKLDESHPEDYYLS